jgi:PKD repeat protein
VGRYGTYSVTSVFDDISYKQILTPSATGVTITSTNSGATYNWAAIATGYNPNVAQTYAIYPPTVNFTANVTTGLSPLDVAFTDQTGDAAGDYTYEWEWGDGTANGTTQNPTHTYASGGVYNVTLTLTDTGSPGGSYGFLQEGYINVSAPATPTPTPTITPTPTGTTPWGVYVDGISTKIIPSLLNTFQKGIPTFILWFGIIIAIMIVARLIEMVPW